MNLYKANIIIYYYSNNIINNFNTAKIEIDNKQYS